MYLVNHFLDFDIFGIDIPDETAAGTTNGADSIMAEVDECNALYGRYPNFILVRKKALLPPPSSPLLSSPHGRRSSWSMACGVLTKNAGSSTGSASAIS